MIYMRAVLSSLILSDFKFHYEVSSEYEQTLSMMMDFQLFIWYRCIKLFQYAQYFSQSNMIVAHQSF